MKLKGNRYMKANFFYIVIAPAVFFVTTSFAQERDLSVEAKTSTANTFVLLIGINQYPRDIPSLEYCVADTEGLAKSLKNVGVPAEHIIIMVDDAKDVALRPSRANIQRQIELVTDLVTENDQLVVAFSGHGAQIDGEAYLCPNDTDLDNRESFLPRKWVYERLESSAARKKLFITDACRNEIVVKGAKSVVGAKSLGDPLGDAESRGFAILASCSKNQKSYEDDSLKHGVFTYFIMRGLEGAADADKDGRVTFDELYDYVFRNTRTHVLTTRQKAQVPMRGGEFSGDFVLAALPKIVAPEVSVTIPKPEPAPRPSGTSESSRKAGESGTSESSRKAGERMVLPVKGVEYAFRWCPAGTFTMGSPEGELGRFSDEKQHQVTLRRGFWMLETEVTQAMWKGITGSNPSHFKGDKLPVEQVSWEDCQKFIEQLNELKVAPSGYRFSLPTEAQWEYACRAGTTTALNSGKNLTDEKYNCPNLNELGWYYWLNENKTTHAVGQKKSNSWGLFDMHGNVWEWCLDWYGDYPNGSVTDPTGASSGSLRVLRGGGWLSDARDCRSAHRNGNDPSNRRISIGVRLSLVRVE